MAGRFADPRFRAMVDAHYGRIWRLVRRLGVPSGESDDAAQTVFMIAHRRLEEIEPEPQRERRYLQGIAIRVASEHRRGERRLRARETTSAELVNAPPQPDELLERKRARERLDQVLDAMPFDLRVAFVLFELDELTVPEIATLLAIPEGTASSRLRRAREDFRQRVAALEEGLR